MSGNPKRRGRAVPKRGAWARPSAAMVEGPGLDVMPSPPSISGDRTVSPPFS
jgi:hypothetical protein